jgi:MFS family permease
MLASWHDHPWQVVLALTLGGFSISLSSIGAKLVADDVRPGEQGVVVGLNMVAFYIGGVIGTQGVAAILDGRLVPGTAVPRVSAFTTSFYLLAAVVVLSIPLALLVHPRGRETVREPMLTNEHSTKRLVR